MLAFLIFFNICLALQAIKHVSAQLVKPESPFRVATEPSRFFLETAWNGTERFAGRETRQPPPRVTHEPKYKFREKQVTAVVIIWRYIRRRGPTDDALRLP